MCDGPICQMSVPQSSNRAVLHADAGAEVRGDQDEEEGGGWDDDAAAAPPTASLQADPVKSGGDASMRMAAMTTPR